MQKSKKKINKNDIVNKVENTQLGRGISPLLQCMHSACFFDHRSRRRLSFKLHNNNMVFSLFKKKNNNLCNIKKP